MSADFGLASEDKPRCDAQVVVELVIRARDGDRQAWNALVDRYAPLIWAICRRYRLDRADAEDVGQIVWLRLLEQLEKIRDRAALTGWLATTAQRECIRVLRTRRPQPAGYAPDAGDVPDDQSGTAEQELLAAERDAALREALARLPASCQQLITLLAPTRQCRMRRSAHGWASRSGTSARTVAGAWKSCAAIRPSRR